MRRAGGEVAEERMVGSQRPLGRDQFSLGLSPCGVGLPGLVDAARVFAPGAPVVLIGHSLGAHAGAMAVRSDSIGIDALVTVAGGNIHYRNWSGAAAAKVLAGGTLFASLTWLFGQMPGQYVGFGGPQARRLIREWSKVIRTGRFPIPGPGAGGPAGSAPALCIAYQGDTFAPGPSVAALAATLAGQVETLPVTWPGNPHSSWARSPQETVVVIEDWLTARGIVDGG